MVLVLHAYAVWRQPIIHPVDFLPGMNKEGSTLQKGKPSGRPSS
uniref:Uncharacterized protein n=1 Tax=Trichinella nativa TaxID=6335 RepID=A0A0V1KI50_9BILA